ncbi:MAG: rRNA maturation RNase YbeY [Lachnospiraceae bacterium]|nr:rRNA maturation RNase YbeY [Lachnospiraceae bacterium]
MTFYVENETEEQFEFNIEELIKSLTLKVLETESVPFKDVTLNVTFTDDESIREINRDFREIDKATDVLSFPAIDFPSAADFSFVEEGSPDYFDPDTKELILGDIMISLERAHAQAEEYGHSFKREIAFLITHSLLHLIGYDHMTDEERTVMEGKQEAVLQALNITREN